MFFFYNENAKSTFTGRFYPEDYNANSMICKHLENYFYLKFILLKSDSISEKHQAAKELTICERKMNFWKRQANFCFDQYQKDISRYKKNWNFV